MKISRTVTLLLASFLIISAFFSVSTPSASSTVKYSKVHHQLWKEMDAGSTASGELIPVIIKPKKGVTNLFKAASSKKSFSATNTVKSDMETVSTSVRNSGGQVKGEYEIGEVVVAYLPADKIDELAEDPNVERIWPDRKVRVVLDESVPHIEAPYMWSRGHDGSGVRIAILDTGIDSGHPMLIGKVVLAEDFTGGGNPEDVYGHGTHCAGIAAGSTANGGSYDGVAPGALLINGKVLSDDGYGSTSGIVAGINWAVDPDGNASTDDGADVISMSLGAAFCDPHEPMSLAIRDAVEAGVLVVVAAGNCGDACPSLSCHGYAGVMSPGCSPYALTVGATDKHDNWACFSSGGIVSGVGTKPDLSAPGVNIRSSVPGGYSPMRGTSMATPHVAGAAALIISANPGMGPEEVRAVLENTANDLGTPGKDTYFGWGLVNMTAASSPMMAVQPMEITEKLTTGETKTIIMTVSNLGGDDLSVDISHDAWIDTDLVQPAFDIVPLANHSFSVILDSASIGTGSREGSVLISSNEKDLSVPVSVAVYDSYFPIIHGMSMPTFAFIGQDIDVSVDVTDDEDVSQVTVNATCPGGSYMADLEKTSGSMWDGVFTVDTEGDCYVEVMATDNAGQHTTANTSIQSGSIFFGLSDEDVIEGESVFITASYMNTQDVLLDLEMELEVTNNMGVTVFRDVGNRDDLLSETVAEFNATWQTGSFGIYVINATASSDGTFLSSVSREITVTLPEIGSIQSFDISPGSVEKGRNATFSVTLSNTGTVPIGAVAEFNVINEFGSVPLVFVSDEGAVAAGTSHMFSGEHPMMLPAGNYTVVAKVHYGSRVAAEEDTLEVHVPAMCRFSSVSWPDEIEMGSTGSFSADVENYGTVTVHGTVEAFIMEGNESVAHFNMGSGAIAHANTVPFAAGRTFEVGPGNYTARLKFHYEGNSETWEKDFTVIDTVPPVIYELNFSRSFPNDSPLIIDAGVTDGSMVGSVNVSVTGPSKAKSEIEMSLSSLRGGESTWTATFTGTSLTGQYTIDATACDDSGNCNSTGDSFTIVPCNSSSLLVISSGETAHLSSALGQYCIYDWDPTKSGEPALEYLERFDAVVWSNGKRWGNIDDGTAELLVNYADRGGRLIVEGSGIAFVRVDDDFMRNVAHSVYYEEMRYFLSGNDTGIVSDEKTMDVILDHPLTDNLPESVHFDQTECPYPDALSPLDGISVMEWNDTGSAMVFYNGLGSGGGKTVFIPFDTAAMNDSAGDQLLRNIARWLLISSDNDIFPTDLSFQAGIITEQDSAILQFSVNNTGPAVEDVTINVMIDGVIDQVLTSDLSMGITDFSVTMRFTQGVHDVKVVTNPDHHVDEEDYTNNAAGISVSAASGSADVVVEEITVSPEQPDEGETASVNVALRNAGGLTAENVTLKVLLDGRVMGTSTFDIIPGGVGMFSSDWKARKGMHNVDVLVDGVHHMSHSFYACDVGSILLLSDNDANSSTGSESTGAIESSLMDGYYCYETWNESGDGLPTVGYMNQFDVIIWSAGNHWDFVIDENEENLLKQWDGCSLIFEGSDIAFDHGNDTFMQETLHSVLDSDIVIDDGAELTLEDHFIFGEIDGISLNATLSPYPDSLEVTDGTGIASWANGSLAVVVHSNDTGDCDEKTVYYAFSLGGIEDAARSRLLSNTLRWTFVIEGDINKDHEVGIMDMVMIGYYYGTSSGDANWNPDVDIHKDGVIDLADLVTMGLSYTDRW